MSSLKESFTLVEFPETISQTKWKVKKSELSNDNFDITSSPKSVPSKFLELFFLIIILIKSYSISYFLFM